jgi:protein-S-isoprenylcysteine O-methyltransferase Ste14
MHLLHQWILGIVILVLLGTLVIVKKAATGSVLDKPAGQFLVQLVNIYNLFFLLIVNPLAAIALIGQRLDVIDPSHLTIEEPLIVLAAELLGLVMYVSGFLLMAWALVTLGRNYQLGGSAPRSEDRMITDGPYKLARHPMYTAALSISLGLALLVQSWAFLCVFFVYLILILRLIPMEEEKLLDAYGEQYVNYKRKTGKLIFFDR